MKKMLVAIVAVTCLGTAAFGGNVDAGRIEIGGSAGLYTSTAENSGVDFQLNPYAMFYLAPGFALGGRVWFETWSNDNNSASTIGLGPRAAYYFDIGSPSFFPYVAGGIKFVSWSNRNNHGSSTSIPLEGGIRLFLNDFVAADMGLNLEFSDGSTAIALLAGFSLFLR